MGSQGQFKRVAILGRGQVIRTITQANMIPRQRQQLSTPEAGQERHFHQIANGNDKLPSLASYRLKTREPAWQLALGQPGIFARHIIPLPLVIEDIYRVVLEQEGTIQTPVFEFGEIEQCT
jgi:hypothetical protein